MYNKIASAKSVEKAVAGLTSRKFTAYVAADVADAKSKIAELIPQGSEVMTMTSITLETMGLVKVFNESGKYDSVKKKLSSMDETKDKAAMRGLGAAPEYTIGSVHAITEDGEIIIASATGSQLPAYAYGAEKVVFVVGTQKIVKDRAAGMERIKEYVLPLESERANKAYNMTAGSSINKLLILDREYNEGRITVVFVPEVLGF